MRTLIREWPTLDPRTGVAVFALWAVCFGVTLAGPGTAFPTSPIYSEIRAYGVPEELVGWLMVVSAAALIWTIRSRTGLSYRLAASFLCGTYWMILGVLLLIGGWNAGLISSAGLFSASGGLGCLYSVRQWMAQE